MAIRQPCAPSIPGSFVISYLPLSISAVSNIDLNVAKS
jgi:hypothetical protein